jgi:hypothetical protein
MYFIKIRVFLSNPIKLLPYSNQQLQSDKAAEQATKSKPMTSVERAKAMFPNMPDEPFNILIAGLLGTDPWPFSFITESTRGTNWHYHLGGLTLYQFSQLRWNLSMLFVNENILHPDSNNDILRLILDHVLDQETAVRRNITNSKERFLWHKAYIERTGTLSAPIVMIRTGNSFRVLDGSHRMAALYSLRLHHSVAVDAWIGSS